LATERSHRTAGYFRTVARFGIQAAEALHHAHEMGVVHRDVKPGNLLVDGRGNVWLSDFGLAHMQTEASLTLSGDLVGTVRYMSPEQALANRVLIDQRTDVYSLGATLYELLTLRPAFRGNDRQELLRQIAFDEPVRPRRINQEVPAELETVVLKAMEKRPEDRYGTAQELADDLHRFLKDEPIRARRPTLRQRAQKWLSRHPAVVRSALLLVLLAAVGSATGAWLLWQEKEQTRHQKILADQARNAAEKRLAGLEKANEILASIFRDLNPDAEERGGKALRVQLGERLQQAARLLEGEAVGDALTVARLQELLGTSLEALGHYEKALSVMKKAEQTREAALGAQHPDTLGTKGNLARLFHRLGKYKRAEAIWQQVVQSRKAKLGADHPDTLSSKGGLALLYQDQGKYDLAEALHKEVMQKLTAKMGPDNQETLKVKNNLASLYQAEGKYALAEALLKEVLQVQTAKWPNDHVSTRAVKNNLAALYSAQGKYAQAELLLKEVLHAFMGKIGPDHPHTLATKVNLAALYRNYKQFDRAEVLCRDVLLAITAKLGPAHHDTLITKNNLAQLLEQQGKYDQAETLHKEVHLAQAANLGGDHPDTLRSKHNLAGVYFEQGKYDRCESLFNEVLKIRMAKLGPTHPETLATKNELGRLYERRGNYERAAALHKEVIQTSTDKLGPDHPYTLVSKTNLARVYWRQEKYQLAEKLVKEVLRVRTAKLGPTHPEILKSKNDLAVVYAEQGKYELAEALHKEALKGLTAILGANDTHTLRSAFNLAATYRGGGRPAEAIALCEKWLPRARKALPNGSKDYYSAIRVCSEIYSGAGRHHKAEPLLGELADLVKQQAGAESPAYAGQLAELGHCLLQQKKGAKAERVLRESLAIRAKKEPVFWTTLNTRSLLGAALLRQKKTPTQSRCCCKAMRA
jgi:lipopolysaccharide biosynthesis regulator YciM